MRVLVKKGNRYTLVNKKPRTTRRYRAGQKYGMVTLLHLDYRSMSHHYWKVKCDCGRVVTKQASKQSLHDRTHCGCLYKKYFWETYGR